MLEAANVATTYSASQLKSSDLEAVLDVSHLCDKWLSALSNHRIREYRNWRAYSGVDAGQYPQEDIEALANEGRDPDQFNVIGRRVDVLLGNEMTQIWDFDWVPVEGQRNSGTESIKETYYCDKELMNFDYAVEQTIKDGLIYRGAMEIGVSTKYNPLGNISLTRLTPGYYFFDPYWITDDDNDCEISLKIGYFNALQIKEIWGKNGAGINADVANLKKFQGDYEQKTFELMSNVSRETKGHLYRVIEKNYLERKKIECLYGWVFNAEGMAHVVPFPQTKDKQKLQEFAQFNGINWENTFVAPHEKRILKVVTVCPQLIEDGLLVKDKEDKIQVGRLKQFHFSSNRAYGVDKGIVDDLYDLQKNINRREAKETNIIETSTGGGKLINENIFKTPGAKDRFLQHSNDPSYREMINGDELEKGVPAVIDLHSANFPGQILDIPRMYQLADLLSPVTTSQTGSQESANTSGVLYERQLAISRIGQLPLDKRIKKLMNDVGEAYFTQWQITYDEVPREFQTRDGEHSVMLNEIVYGADGTRGVKNRPSYTPRCRVVVTESPKSETWQMRKRFFYADLLKFIPPDYRSHISFILGIILKTLDVSDKEKAEFEQLSKMQQFKDAMAAITELTNMQATTDQAKLTSLQANTMMQQMIQQMQQPTPPPGAGMMPEQINMEQAQQPQLPPPQAEPIQMEPEQLQAIGSPNPPAPALL